MSTHTGPSTTGATRITNLTDTPIVAPVGSVILPPGDTALVGLGPATSDLRLGDDDAALVNGIAYTRAHVSGLAPWPARCPNRHERRAAARRRA